MSKYYIVVFVIASFTLALLGGCISKNEEGEIALSEECTWYGGVECEAACESAEFNLACQGECSAEIDMPSCQASCEGKCETECDLDPGNFSCDGYCGGECKAYCSGECEANDNALSCEGECEAWCEGECAISCDAEPVEFSCDGSCEASCEGSCTAGNVEFDCWVDCEIDPPFDCEGSCESDGFYECNGEFISTGDVEDALDWIEANLPEVEIYADASGECYGNTCHAEGSCGMECAVGSTGNGSPVGIFLFLLAIGSAILLRRR